MSTTVIMHRDDKDQALKDYIHIIDDDNCYIVYVSKNGSAKRFGSYLDYREALKSAKNIQKRHRFLIIHQDDYGNIINTYQPQLNALSSGEKAKRIIRRKQAQRKLSTRYE